MKIAIDVSPISETAVSGHRVRGVGSYIKLLEENIQKFDKKNSYVFFKTKKEITDDVDLIHYPYFDPFFVTIPFQSKHKVVITIHDLTPIVFKNFFPVGVKGMIKWNTQKLLLRKVPKVITDSESSKKDIVKYAHINESRISVVYLAVDKSFMPPSVEVKEKVRRKYGLPRDFLLYVGDVTWNKNLPRIIDAVNSYKKLPLVIVGKTIAMEDFDKRHPWNKDLVYVQDHIQNNDLFIRLGYVDKTDLSGLYSSAKALLMPSLYEGFGLPVLEAMSCGCPVITSRAGSLAEVGGDAVTYVDELSTKDIINGIKKLENETERIQIIKNEMVQAKKFSVEKTMRDTIAVYESL